MTAPAPRRDLRVRDLRVQIGDRRILDGVSLDVPSGERLGVIGASGSGKSMLALALLGLTPSGAEVRGSIRLGATELVGQPDRERARSRGSGLGIVFQEPGTALDPLRRVGAQIVEPLRRSGASRTDARAGAIRLAASVGLPEPGRLLRQYPHQLSGGQRQRICIAIALAGDPDVIVADEPTTALDVTTQARILERFQTATAERGQGLLFVTHDLAVLAQVADTAVVLDRGQVVETGPVTRLLTAPQHRATAALVEAARATARMVRT
ncbi:ABC transporter ATP-binding protein [Curtobacterium ammoniigenes]|uniref:ABC transporter ATP-binding protein n=1 Tax=Curtobacterium ammoniigenes TaxID=395387 RepID=UPI00082CF46A|nr:ABC transporter ATP-binding protein [Curtobacterium ammoniigenes]